MFSPFQFRGHSNQYAEFRKKPFFVDCEYHDNQKSYKAHKIILSTFSSLLRNYFIKNSSNSPNPANSAVHQLPIPYNISMFENLVQYFYDTHLILDKVDSTKLLPWLSMGYIYDVKTINEIIEPIISERFLNNPKDDNLDTILQFSEYYKKVQLNNDCAEYFDGIEQNLQKFMESQQMFVSYLEDRFEIIEKDKKRLSKLTPYLISEILKKKHNFDDVRKAKILEDYVKVLRIGKVELKDDDRKILQDVINWENDNAYELFTYSDLDWVLPEISRPQIVKLLRARRRTLKSLEEDQSIKQNKLINHWFAISCVNDIETAHHSTNQSYSIIHFIGTLGNSNKVDFINPKKFNFLKSNFSPSISDSMKYGDLSIYDEENNDPKVYYLSECFALNKLNLPYVGFSLPESHIDLEDVVLTSSSPKINNRPKKMKLILDNKDILSSVIKDDKISFHLQKSIKAKDICIKVEINEQPNKDLFFALRVNHLEVYGRFLPDV